MLNERDENSMNEFAIAGKNTIQSGGNVSEISSEIEEEGDMSLAVKEGTRMINGGQEIKIGGMHALVRGSCVMRVCFVKAPGGDEEEHVWFQQLYI